MLIPLSFLLFLLPSNKKEVEKPVVQIYQSDYDYFATTDAWKVDGVTFITYGWFSNQDNDTKYNTAITTDDSIKAKESIKILSVKVQDINGKKQFVPIVTKK